MIFKNKKFIIHVDFSEFEEEDHYCHHNTFDNKIHFNIKGWYEAYIKLDWESNQLENEFHTAITHELTHWFDSNCYNLTGLIHYGLKVNESIAIFNSLFVKDIEEFANMIMDSKIVKKYLEA